MTPFFLLISSGWIGSAIAASSDSSPSDQYASALLMDNYIKNSLCKETIKSVTIAHFAIFSADPHALFDTYNTQIHFLLDEVDDDKPLSILKQVLLENAMRDDQFFVDCLQVQLPLNLKEQTEGAIIRKACSTANNNRQIISPDVMYYFKVRSLDDLIDMVEPSHEYHAKRLFREWYNYYHELQQASPLHKLAFSSSQTDPPIQRHLEFLESFLRVNPKLDHAYTFANHMCLFHLFEYLRHLLILLIRYGFNSITNGGHPITNVSHDWKQLKQLWFQYKKLGFQRNSIRLIYRDFLLKKRPLWHLNNGLYSMPLSGAQPVEKMEVRHVPTTGIGYMHCILVSNRIIIYTSISFANNTQVGSYICKRGIDRVYHQQYLGLSISEFLTSTELEYN